MDRVVITSVNNEKIKFLEKLKEKKYRDASKLFLVEDAHLVQAAYHKGLIKEIITTDPNLDIAIPLVLVSEKIMKLLSTQVSGAKVIAVCSQLEPAPVKGNIIVLDDLQDPGNLGTIIRSAVAFNFTTIVLSSNSVDLYNPKVVRASEGLLFYVNIIRTDIVKFLKELDSSYTKITTNVIKGKDIKKVNYSKCALVIGNEGKGVSKEVANLCEEEVYIQMHNNCESLNAAVTASILMYEVAHE